MAATVAIMTDQRAYIHVEVPEANYARVDSAGRLELHTGVDSFSPMAGLFKQWDHVVIDQRWLRDPHGRFVSKDRRET